MPGDRLSHAAAVVGYQDVTLTELRSLFDQLDVDLRDVLEREARVSGALDDTESHIAALRSRLGAMGIAVPDLGAQPDEVLAGSGDFTSRPGYDLPLVPAEDDFGRLHALAEARLERLGIDLTRDPLQQVLPSSEIARSLRAYTEEHGEITWDATDWAVVIGAGALATLADILLVRIPQDTTFLRSREEYAGSPLTKWLKEQSGDVHQEFLQGFEKVAKVPYDASTTAATGGLVSGMAPRNHRLKSPGHDPLAGFLFGVRDLMQGVGTYSTQGKLIQVRTDYDQVNLIEAFLTHARHLLSDVATPAGLPAPLFTLLQLGDGESPFIRVRAGVEMKASWAEISQYMYLNGYDLRHFYTMGITPFVVEATIRGSWLLNSYLKDKTEDRRRLEKAKLTSMLLLGHAIATSGTLLKTGLIYGMNPLALNYNQLLAMTPATIAWFEEAVERDHRISQALENEWQSILTQSSR